MFLLESIVAFAVLFFIIWATSRMEREVCFRTMVKVMGECRNGLTADMSLGMKVEGFLLSPANPFVLPFVKKVYDAFKPVYVYSLDDYVTFTRLNTSKGQRISCDFCSIVNGIIHLCMDSALHWEQKTGSGVTLNEEQRELLGVMHAKMLEILRFRQTSQSELNQQSIDYASPFKANEMLYLFKKVDFLVTQAELRWCPFRAMQNYFRNADPRFIPANKENLYEAGRILAQFDTIECYSCSKQINEQIDPQLLVPPEQVQQSVMYEYYQYLKQ